MNLLKGFGHKEDDTASSAVNVICNTRAVKRSQGLRIRSMCSQYKLSIRSDWAETGKTMTIWPKVASKSEIFRSSVYADFWQMSVIRINFMQTISRPKDHMVVIGRDWNRLRCRHDELSNWHIWQRSMVHQWRMPPSLFRESEFFVTHVRYRYKRHIVTWSHLDKQYLTYVDYILATRHSFLFTSRKSLGSRCWKW